MPLVPPSKIAVSSLATRKPASSTSTTAAATSSTTRPAATKIASPATTTVSALRKPSPIAASTITSPSRLTSPAKRAVATASTTPASSVRTAAAAARPLSAAKTATKPVSSASPTASTARARRTPTPAATPPANTASPPQPLSRETSHASSPADSPRSVSSIASSSFIPQPTALRLPTSIRPAAALASHSLAGPAPVVPAQVKEEAVDAAPVVPDVSPPVTVVHPEEHAKLLASHQQLQAKVDSLTTQLQEWQAAEAARQTAVEEKASRHNELLSVVHATLEAVVTQHQQYVQQQAEQAAGVQQQWQQTVQQQKADTAAAFATQRDELLTALATHKQELTIALTSQHDSDTAALATLDTTVSQHSTSIAQLVALDDEVGSIRTVLETYNEDISGLVEREETVRGKVEALRVESEQLLGMASDVSGRCKRVESEVVDVKRACVDQAAEWKAAWTRVEARVDEQSGRLKEWIVGWAEERRALQGAIQQLVSGQHAHEKTVEALSGEVQQLRHLIQRQHSGALTASRPAEMHGNDKGMAETKEAADDVERADVSSTAVDDDSETSELASSSHFTADGLGTPIHASLDADGSSTASPFLSLSPTSRAAATPLSLSADSILPGGQSPSRSHSISLPTSPSDLSSVFPSMSQERQAGVFTSPAKVVQSTQAMAWTINVKEGKASATAAAASTPPPRHTGGNSRDSAVTPRSAASANTSVHRHSGSGTLSASAGKGSGGSGKSSVASSGKSSVSGSGVSSPSGKVSRQLATELDGSSGGGGRQAVADVIVAADDDGPLNDTAADDEEETY